MTTATSQSMVSPGADTDVSTHNSAAQTAVPMSPRTRIARLILVYHFVLIGISCVFYILRGFDFEEFTSLMGVLAPITALYGGAVFRFLGRSITEPSLNGQNNAPVNSLVKWLVHGHFVTVMLLITLKALAPNVLNFQDMTMFLTLVESALGVYMGNIILALFEGNKENGKS
jgi:hypothetical protein